MERKSGSGRKRELRERERSVLCIYTDEGVANQSLLHEPLSRWALSFLNVFFPDSTPTHLQSIHSPPFYSTHIYWANYSVDNVHSLNCEFTRWTRVYGITVFCKYFACLSWNYLPTKRGVGLWVDDCSLTVLPAAYGSSLGILHLYYMHRLPYMFVR